MSKCHQYTKGDDQSGGCVKPRCLNLERCLNVCVQYAKGDDHRSKCGYKSMKNLDV